MGRRQHDHDWRYVQSWAEGSRGKLCQTIASHLDDFSERAELRGAGRHPYAFEEADDLSANWWPSRLGRPSSTGSQNNMRYACFPQIHRLAIERDGKLTVYDPGTHRLSGFSQQQSPRQSLSFINQHRPVRLEDLQIEKFLKLVAFEIETNVFLRTKVVTHLSPMVSSNLLPRVSRITRVSSP
jgi:hypothetical protein